MRPARQAERVRLDFPVRRPGVGVLRQGGAVLPLSLRRAASAGTGAVVRRRRRARRAPRDHRVDPGARDDQVDPRRGRLLDRPPAAVRRAQAQLPRAEAREGPRLPGVRATTDCHRAGRLRGVLRRRRGAEL